MNRRTQKKGTTEKSSGPYTVLSVRFFRRSMMSTKLSGDSWNHVDWLLNTVKINSWMVRILAMVMAPLSELILMAKLKKMMMNRLFEEAIQCIRETHVGEQMGEVEINFQISPIKVRYAITLCGLMKWNLQLSMPWDIGLLMLGYRVVDVSV